MVISQHYDNLVHSTVNYRPQPTVKMRFFPCTQHGPHSIGAFCLVHSIAHSLSVFHLVHSLAHSQ